MPEAGWRLADLLWERLSEAALAAFDSGHADHADELWNAAQTLAEGFATNDPRRASSLNNRAVACRIAGDADEAVDLCRRALAGWTAADIWVDCMAVEPRARSSLFHLRLESKHRDRYRALARDDYRRLLRAGGAATARNLARMSGDLPNDDAGEVIGLARWRATRPASFNDLRKLTAAALLSAEADAVAEPCKNR